MSIPLQHNQPRVFDRYLKEDESILWQGGPDPRALLRGQDAGDITVAFIMAVFVLRMQIDLMKIGDYAAAFCCTFPFFLVLQYMLWGRFIFRYRMRNRTWYALTERRALVLDLSKAPKLTAYLLDEVDELKKEGRTVLFKPNLYAGLQSRRHLYWTGEEKGGFYALADADRVYAQARQLIEQAKQPPQTSEAANAEKS